MVNGKLRLSLRLMSAVTGDVLLMRSVEADAGSADSTLARVVAPAILSILDAKDWSRITLTSQDPGMRNQAAREFILSGRQLMFRGNIADFGASIRCLERALQIEPDSAIAHAYLSSTQAARVHFVPDRHLLERAESEAEFADRNLISIARFKSNRDYSLELHRRAHSFPDLLSVFGENLSVFERTWYGAHDIDRDRVDQFAANVQRIKGTA